MPDTLSGMPSATIIQTFTDLFATVFKNNRASFDTFLTNCQTLRGALSTIGHDSLEAQTKLWRDNKVQNARYETVFKGDKSLISVLDNIIAASLPGSWSLNGILPLNGWLTRINGNSGIVTPTAVLTLTAATTSGGALATATSGNAPRVIYTLVGSNDMYESLVSAEATQVALVGGQNSYTGVFGSYVLPAGITKVRIYRGLPGIATGTWYWDQDIAVVAGTNLNTYPIIIQRPDAFLATTIVPPSWMCCPQTPEFAYEYGLATATVSPVRGNDTAPFQMTSTGMMSAGNVALGPSNGWIGRGNAVSSAQFGTQDLTGAYVPGAIQTSNVPANNSQGFCGSLNGLQLRATTQLNGTAHFTISYQYTDATHPTLQTQSGVTSVSDFVGGLAQETVLFTVAAGRIVQTATITGKTGTSTTGVVCLESQAVRVY